MKNQFSTALKRIGLAVATSMSFLILIAPAHSAFHPFVDLDRLDTGEFLFICQVDELNIVPPSQDEVYWRLTECEKFITQLSDRLIEHAVHGYRACISSDTSLLELVDVGIIWLEDHPHDLDRPADEVIAKALSVDWPCT